MLVISSLITEIVILVNGIKTKETDMGFMSMLMV